MPKHRGKRGDFWSKVDRSAGENDCWPWIGSMGSGGYGQVRVNKRLEKSHRVAWVKANGEPIPQGLVVCHRCDNPACCNPAHLFIGKQADNVRDMDRKGRANRPGVPAHIPRPRGEQNAHSKLTATDVREIRHIGGSITNRALGRRFNVSDVLIGKILRREIWNHL